MHGEAKDGETMDGKTDFRRVSTGDGNSLAETDVDGRKWVKRHLSTALESEEVDEKDFHVATALRLLTEDE